MRELGEPDTYRIELDRRWSLEDLYTYPRTYSQVYAFLYSLLAQGEERDEDGEAAWEMEHEWLDDPYLANPWIGGYDAVNFYRQLERRVPKVDRPQVLGLHYGSPGWIDLGLVVAVAVAIRSSVGAFVRAARELHDLYDAIYKGMRERKLMDISVKRQELSLEREKLEFIEDSTARLARLLGVGAPEKLHRRTGNPLASLRILLSYYRRVRTLARYSEKGKAKP
jgi:hypothetical protein